MFFVKFREIFEFEFLDSQIILNLFWFDFKEPQRSVT